MKPGALLLWLVLSLPLTLMGSAVGGPAAAKPHKKEKMVYVCACLKTRSCSCMTEAKTEGPCSCGTEGGPPMKAVPRDGKWAKTNRNALAH